MLTTLVSGSSVGTESLTGVLKATMRDPSSRYPSVGLRYELNHPRQGRRRRATRPRFSRPRGVRSDGVTQIQTATAAVRLFVGVGFVRPVVPGAAPLSDCYGAVVDEDSFWALVAQCRQQSDNDTELASRILFRRLRALSAAEVIAFVQTWKRMRSRLHSWPVADAVCLMLGAVEEEDLRFIQDWIISYGRAVVDQVVANPDYLVNLSNDAGRARATWFDEFMTEAHILVSSIWPQGFDPEGPEEPTGKHMNLRDHSVVERHFPRLAAFRADHPGLGVPELR
jgi:hypothetical protein